VGLFMTPSIIKPTNEDHQIAKLAAIATVLSLIEFFLPSPIPGVKPGIANIITLYALIKFNFHVAFWVSIIRVLVSSLLVGSFLNPTFFLSITGALFSLGILYFIFNLYGKYFGVLSLSLAASIFHIIGQFIVVRFWIIPHDSIFNLLPVFLLSAFIFGLVNGMIVYGVLQQKPHKYDVK
jgi:heptaprenyl diphosphate synthase